MKIKENRKKLNMTQADLAQELNIAKSTISKWENGTMEPSIDDASKMAKIFDISIDHLISGEIVQQKLKPVVNNENVLYKNELFSNLEENGGNLGLMYKYTYSDHYNKWKQGKMEEKTIEMKKPLSVISLFGMRIHLAMLFWTIYFAIPWILPPITIFVLINKDFSEAITNTIWVSMSLGLWVVIYMIYSIILWEFADWEYDLESGNMELWPFMPLVTLYMIFIVDWKEGKLVNDDIWHNDTFYAYLKYFDVKSYDGENIRIYWKDVLNIQIPNIFVSDDMSYLQRNQMMMSGEVGWGLIEIDDIKGKKIVIHSQNSADLSLLKSIWKRQLT